jgi:hypothetical protein
VCSLTYMMNQSSKHCWSYLLYICSEPSESWMLRDSIFLVNNTYAESWSTAATLTGRRRRRQWSDRETRTGTTNITRTTAPTSYKGSGRWMVLKPYPTLVAFRPQHLPTTISLYIYVTLFIHQYHPWRPPINILHYSILLVPLENRAFANVLHPQSFHYHSSIFVIHGATPPSF